MDTIEPVTKKDVIFDFYSTYNVKTAKICVCAVGAKGAKSFKRDVDNNQMLKGTLDLYITLLSGVIQPGERFGSVKLRFFRFKDQNLGALLGKIIKAVDLVEKVSPDERDEFMGRHFLKKNYARIKSHDQAVELTKILLRLKELTDGPFELASDRAYDDYSKIAYGFTKEEAIG